MAAYESADGAIRVYDTAMWIEVNEKDFVPPVCNKCMFADQLKVFFVGGPNSRSDYHIEEGEEIFFQFKGDMVLKVVESGRRRDVRIREGELFVLPARVEHSPQRFAGTMGCVVERERDGGEFDGLRYFVDDADSPSVLWERWFHLTDVVKDLPPVIGAFNASVEKASGKPGAASFKRDAPYTPRDVTLSAPFNLDTHITTYIEAINKAPQQLLAGKTGGAVLTLYGVGMHTLRADAHELILLFQRGEGTLTCGADTTAVRALFTSRIAPHTAVQLHIADGGVCLVASIARHAS